MSYRLGGMVSEVSLYERLGGEAAIEASVCLFYDKVLEDSLLAPFFDGVDVDALVRKQIGFMSVAFGGPNDYTGRKLSEAHADARAKGLADVHFDAVAGHLRATLEELEVGEETIVEVLAVVETTRQDVLG